MKIFKVKDREVAPTLTPPVEGNLDRRVRGGSFQGPPLTPPVEGSDL